MVRGMKTLGEKVTRLPWARRRRSRARADRAARGAWMSSWSGTDGPAALTRVEPGSAGIGATLPEQAGTTTGPDGTGPAYAEGRSVPVTLASTNHTTSSAVTRPAGRSSPPTMRWKGPRFDASVTVKTTRRA